MCRQICQITKKKNPFNSRESTCVLQKARQALHVKRSSRRSQREPMTHWQGGARARDIPNRSRALNLRTYIYLNDVHHTYKYILHTGHKEAGLLALCLSIRLPRASICIYIHVAGPSSVSLSRPPPASSN